MKNNKKFKTIIILAIVVLVLSYAGRLIKMNQDSRKSDQVVLRFVISSQAMVSEAYDESLDNFFIKPYEYAEQMTYNRIDAFIMNGGLTADGSDESYAMADEQIQNRLRNGSHFIEVTGEQDFSTVDNNMDSPVLKRAKDQVVNIKGFRFLFLTPNYSSYADKLQWLDAQLEEMTRDNPMPVFVCMYGAMKNTYYGSKSWYTYDYKDMMPIFEKYPTAVVFSSSTMSPANIGRSIFWKNASYVNTGTMSMLHMGYKDFDFEMQTGALFPRSNDVSQCRIVEVYGNGTVSVKTMDLLEGRLYTTAGCNDITWKPGEHETYLTDTLGTSIGVPHFEKKDVVLTTSEEGLVVCFYRAQDENDILLYEILVEDKNRNTIRHFEYATDFLQEPVEYELYLFENLSLEDVNKVEITAYDFCGEKGETLTWYKK